MSNDLISRKAVIQAVDKHTTEDGKLDDDISVILEEIPTAYDVDAVCEELPRHARLYGTIGVTCEYAIPKDTAIEIVRNGGIKS